MTLKREVWDLVADLTVMEGLPSGILTPASTASSACPLLLRISHAAELACSPNFHVDNTIGLFGSPAITLANSFELDRMLAETKEAEEGQLVTKVMTKEEQDKLTPDLVLQQLKDGNARFHNEKTTPNGLDTEGPILQCTNRSICPKRRRPKGRRAD